MKTEKQNSQETASTDARRVELALQIIRTAKAGLSRAVADLRRADDVGLLSSPHHIERALYNLDLAESDLAGEDARIEQESLDDDGPGETP